MAKTPGDVREELLVMRARGHDPAALSELVQRWHERLLTHARRLTRDPHGAEEAVQESWIAVVKGIHRLNHPAAFASWIYRILGRECSHWVDRQQRVRLRPTPDNMQDATDQSHTTDSTDELAPAMANLSVAHREVLALHYMQCWSLEQIAEALNLNLGTVKSRLHYARQALRQSLRCESHE